MYLSTSNCIEAHRSSFCVSACSGRRHHRPRQRGARSSMPSGMAKGDRHAEGAEDVQRTLWRPTDLWQVTDTRSLSGCSCTESNWCPAGHGKIILTLWIALAASHEPSQTETECFCLLVSLCAGDVVVRCFHVLCFFISSFWNGCYLFLVHS